MSPDAHDLNRGLFLSVVENAIPRIAEAIESKHYLTRHDYLEVKTKPSGIPEFSTSSDGPVDVASLFRNYGEYDADVDESTIPGFAALVDLLVTDDRFVEVFGVPNSSDEKYTRMFARGIVLDVIEGTYHKSRTAEDAEIESIFNEVYEPVALYVNHDSLDFDLAIPIMFTLFDRTGYEFDDRISIEEISQQLHRQRASINSYSPATATPVISGSTHMLRLTGYSLRDRWNMWLLSQRTHQIDLYPTDTIENFFLAMDLAADVQSGYCQILAIPVNWTPGYVADRPYIYGAPVRLYPPHFDNYHWNQDRFPKVSSESVEQIFHYFKLLLSNTNNKIALTQKRLRSAVMRADEEDELLDLIIALELLLGDNQPTEMTHKLAMRTAALLSYIDGTIDPIETFRSVKKLYNVRSRLVHGSRRPRKDRDLAARDSVIPNDVVKQASLIVKTALRAVLDHPDLESPHAIDEELLLGRTNAV